MKVRTEYKEDNIAVVEGYDVSIEMRSTIVFEEITGTVYLTSYYSDSEVINTEQDKFTAGSLDEAVSRERNEIRSELKRLAEV